MSTFLCTTTSVAPRLLALRSWILRRARTRSALIWLAGTALRWNDDPQTMILQPFCNLTLLHLTSEERIMENKKNPTGTPTTTGGSFNPSSPTEGNTPGSTQTARDIGGNNPTETRPGKEGGGNLRSFKCRDVGFKECPWETSGTEQEMRPRIEQHG